MKGPVPDSWCDSVNPLMFCVGLWRWPGGGAGQDGSRGVGGFDPLGTRRLRLLEDLSQYCVKRQEFSRVCFAEDCMRACVSMCVCMVKYAVLHRF